MTTLFSDTTPEAEAVLLDLIEQAPTWKRFKMVEQLNTRMKIMMMAGLRLHYPKASESELHRRMADLLLGEELAKRVYGPL